MTFEQLTEVAGYNVSRDDWEDYPEGAWVHRNAVIGRSTEIGPDAAIFRCSIGRGCTIGRGTVISYGTMIGAYCSIGHRCYLYDNVVVGSSVIVGDDVGIWSRVIIPEGFRIANGDTWMKSPLVIHGSRHLLRTEANGDIRIGCQIASPEWWLSSYGTGFAEANEYDVETQEEYRSYVLAAQTFMRRAKPWRRSHEVGCGQPVTENKP